MFGLHAVISFALAACTAAKIGSNYNYFIEPSWAAMFCLALVMARWQARTAYPWALAAMAALLIQSAARTTPHLRHHYQRIEQWPQTTLAVQKYGQLGPLLTMQVGAQVLSGQQPYVADVFILSCLSRRDAFDVGPIVDALRSRKIVAVIARDDIRPDLGGDVIWTDSEREAVAMYYRPIEQFGDLTVFIPRLNPREDLPVRSSDDSNWTGPQRSYYQNGQLAWEMNMVRGRKHGVERFWDSGGRLWREVHYVQGVREGPEVTWYENGQKASTVEYRNGRRNGVEITWYESGSKWTEMPYADGVPHGVATRWAPGGTKIGETHWDHGVMDRNQQVLPLPETS